jgi:hypothetical protein
MGWSRIDELLILNSNTKKTVKAIQTTARGSDFEMDLTRL